MNSNIKEFVEDCLVGFDRDDRLQLVTQRASADSRGECLSEMAVPPSCLIQHDSHTPCDLFDVELALLLFERQQRRVRKH